VARVATEEEVLAEVVSPLRLYTEATPMLSDCGESIAVFVEKRDFLMRVVDFNVVFGRWRDLLGDFVMDVFLVEALVGVERSIVKLMQYRSVVS
jgi:hypothetical protein